MGVVAKFTFKAPKLVKYLKEMGIEVSIHKGVFTESSFFALPSEESACICDEDAWGATLYGPQEMGLPRSLCGIGEGCSFSQWLLNRLTDVDEDDEEDEENCVAFCREAKEIIEKKFSDGNLAQLDDLIEEAQVLYFNYWGGTDFDYSYAELKGNEASYWSGCGEDDPVYEDWRWRNLDEFIKLVKKQITPQTFTRANGNWIKKK